MLTSRASLDVTDIGRCSLNTVPVVHKHVEGPTTVVTEMARVSEASGLIHRLRNSLLPAGREFQTGDGEKEEKKRNSTIWVCDHNSFKAEAVKLRMGSSAGGTGRQCGFRFTCLVGLAAGSDEKGKVANEGPVGNRHGAEPSSRFEAGVRGPGPEMTTVTAVNVGPRDERGAAEAADDASPLTRQG